MKLIELDLINHFQGKGNHNPVRNKTKFFESGLQFFCVYWAMLLQKSWLDGNYIFVLNPKEFDDPQVYDDPKGIWIRSMDFDNPKVYGDIPSSSMFLFSKWPS